MVFHTEIEGSSTGYLGMDFKLFLLWCFVILGRPQDLFTALQAVRPALLLSALCIAAAFFRTSSEHFRSLLGLKETKKYLFFYLIMILSIPFAYYKSLAFEEVFYHYLSNMLFFIVLIREVNSLDRLKSLLKIICLSTLFFGFFGLMYGVSEGQRLKIYGAMFDPNDIAYVLLTLFPLCMFFILHNVGIVMRMLALVAICSAVIVILLSASRGGLMGLAGLFLALLFTRTEKLKRSHKISLLIVLVGIYVYGGGYLNIDRYMTLLDIGSDYNVTDEAGRLTVWKLGLNLFISHPITGVGVECFASALAHHQLAWDLGNRLAWKASHNSYLQIAVETGLAGFMVFMSLIIGCFRSFSGIKGIHSTSKNASELRSIAGLLQIGFIGSLISAFFLSQGYSIFFTLFFGFSAALRVISAQLDEQRPGSSPLAGKRTPWHIKKRSRA